MTAHTPGEWKAKLLIYTGNYAILRTTNHGDRRVDDKQGEFSKADAQLIAAAPDLLAACRQLIHQANADGWHNEGDCEVGSAYWALPTRQLCRQWAGRAAIAKAKGE
jgi:hypothetical protein